MSVFWSIISNDYLILLFQIILLITSTETTRLGTNCIRLWSLMLFYFLLSSYNSDPMKVIAHREENQGSEWFTQALRGSLSYPLSPEESFSIWLQPSWEIQFMS